MEGTTVSFSEADGSYNSLCSLSNFITKLDRSEICKGIRNDALSNVLEITLSCVVIKFCDQGNATSYRKSTLKTSLFLDWLLFWSDILFLLS